MSHQPPHRLLTVAIQSLLSEETLAIEAVEVLPREPFPPVFMEAFSRGHATLLKAMVQCWPFPTIPLGALMSMRDPETLNTQEDVADVVERMFHAVLDGLDVLLRQKACSRWVECRDPE